MNKAESIAYLRKLRKAEDELLTAADGVLPTSKSAVTEELGQMETFQEFARDKESQKKGLTSDEK